MSALVEAFNPHIHRHGSHHHYAHGKAIVRPTTPRVNVPFTPYPVSPEESAAAQVSAYRAPHIYVESSLLSSPILRPSQN